MRATELAAIVNAQYEGVAMTRKPQFFTADAVRIDEINDGHIAIIVDTDEGDKLYIDIHAVALDFEQSVRANLRPYALEAEHARTAVAAGIPRHVYLGLPDPDEPDHDLSRDLERGK